MNKNIPNWVIVICLILYSIFYALLSIDLYHFVKTILANKQAFGATLLLIWFLTITAPIVILFSNQSKTQSNEERRFILLPPLIIISGMLVVLVHAVQIVQYVTNYLF